MALPASRGKQSQTRTARATRSARRALRTEVTVALIEFPHHLHHLPFEGDAPHAKRQQGLLVVCGAMFISAVDMTIVNVALPDISEDLNAGTGELQ